MKFLFALFALGSISAVFGQSCTDPTDLENCVYKSSFFMNRDTTLPGTLDEMREHCNNGQTSITCLLEFNERCVMGPPSISLKKIYSMVQRGLNDRCSNDDKLQEFVDHLRCLKEDENKIEMVRQCADRHIRHLEQLIDVEPVQRTGPLCCVFKYFHTCVKDVIQDQCGDDVAQYFENLLNEYVSFFWNCFLKFSVIPTKINLILFVYK